MVRAYLFSLHSRAGPSNFTSLQAREVMLCQSSPLRCSRHKLQFFNGVATCSNAKWTTLSHKIFDALSMQYNDGGTLSFSYV